jgi:hypothetical protein
MKTVPLELGFRSFERASGKPVVAMPCHANDVAYISEHWDNIRHMLGLGGCVCQC